MKNLLIILSIISCGFSTPHPLHVTIMQMDHNAENNTLEVTLKTFVDDFEFALKNATGKKVFLNEMMDTDSSHLILENLIRKMVSYKINEESIAFTWIGWEIEKDEVFIYYELSLPKKVKSISVENRLLMKEYIDQANIVHLKYKGKNKSFVLEDLESEKEFVFNN